MNGPTYCMPVSVRRKKDARRSPATCVSRRGEHLPVIIWRARFRGLPPTLSLRCVSRSLRLLAATSRQWYHRHLVTFLRGRMSDSNVHFPWKLKRCTKGVPENRKHGEGHESTLRSDTSPDIEGRQGQAPCKLERRELLRDGWLTNKTVPRASARQAAAKVAAPHWRRPPTTYSGLPSVVIRVRSRCMLRTPYCTLQSRVLAISTRLSAEYQV